MAPDPLIYIYIYLYIPALNIPTIIYSIDHKYTYIYIYILPTMYSSSFHIINIIVYIYSIVQIISFNKNLLLFQPGLGIYACDVHALGCDLLQFRDLRERSRGVGSVKLVYYNVGPPFDSYRLFYNSNFTMVYGTKITMVFMGFISQHT